VRSTAALPADERQRRAAELERQRHRLDRMDAA